MGVRVRAAVAIAVCLLSAGGAARADAPGPVAVVVLAVDPGATVSLFAGQSDGSIWKRASAAPLTA